MVDSALGLSVAVVALLLFAWVGLSGARRFGIFDRDGYLTARRSQGALPLALSFFASALGGWILFSPPEVGTFAGVVGVIGYAIGQGAAVAIFAWLGPAVRRRVPEGTTVLDFVRLRFGRLKQAYVGGISLLYMFVFLTAELTAVGGVLALLAGTGRAAPILAVAAVTAAYTAYGGLPASIATDRWQAWLVMALVVSGFIAVAGTLETPVERAVAGGLGDIHRTGAEVAVVLVIAIVAANLFHQGLWQRVWAAKDAPALVRGTLGGGLAILPLIFAMGLAGMVAAGGEGLENPSLAFFALMQELPPIIVLGVVALSVSLVASTIDTLQNGLTSLISMHVGTGRISLRAARVITLILTVPAAVIALQGLSVLRLFLIADLLAATIALPVFLGLWRRTSRGAALAGAVAGLAGIVAFGWVSTGNFLDGLLVLTLPEGPSLGAFLSAPLASGAVTLLWTLVSPADEDTLTPATDVRSIS